MNNETVSNSKLPEVIYDSVFEANNIIEKLGFSPEKNEQKILLISDKKIWDKYQNFFGKNFQEQLSEILILQNPKAEESQLKKILKSAKNSQLIIALGSGTISDLSKLASAQLSIPYLMIPTAPSMNGYLSKNASIKISGHKKTLPATLPIAVICDLKLLSKAPSTMIKAGIGDVMSFYSCWFDWYLSHKVLGTNFDAKPFEILSEKMEFLVNNFAQFSLHDEKFLKILIELLFLSGIGMTMAGGSYPASQSEHLIAHCLDMKFPKKMVKILHGNQIAITIFSSIKLQKKILELDSLQIKKIDFPQKDLEKFFAKEVVLECKKEFEQKIPSDDRLNEINDSLKNNWSDLKKDLSKIFLPEEKLRLIFSHFKLQSSRDLTELTYQQYQACVNNAKFIRNRFTCLDITTYE